MNPHLYHFNYQDLNVSYETIAKFLGYSKVKPPDPFPALIDEAMERAKDLCDIRGGFIIREDIAIDRENKTLSVDGVTFHVKKIITNQLKKADQLAIFACTAGPGISNWSKKLMHEGDMLKGYVVDVIGSEIVETAMDLIQDDLEEKMESSGLHITDRLSPGYCDWSVGEQHKLFSFLPAQFCGITLSDSALMQPIKSVSGVIGIGDKVRKKGYVCNMCDMVNCIYREKRQLKAEKR